MDIHVNIPTAWKHLTPQQFSQVAQVMSRPQPFPELLSHIFLKLAQWRVVSFAETGYIFKSRQTKQKFIATPGQFTTLCNSVTWAVDSFTELSFAPAFRGLTAPNPLLFNTTLEQFMQADNLHAAYIKTQKPVYMKRIIRTYWQGKTLFFVRAKHRMQAFIWFSGVKKYMATRYSYLYSGSAGSATPADPASEIISILSALNGGDVTRNEKILQSHVHEVFHELNLLAEQHHKSKQNVLTV
jgi:hypothetical protein